MPAIITGISKGLVEQLVSLASLLVGVWAAFHFSSTLAEWLNGYLQVDPKIINICAFALTVIFTVLILNLIGKLITKTLKMASLGWANRLLGLVFALLKAGLLIGIAIILFDTLNVKFEFVEEKVLDESVLYAPIRDIAYVIFPYLKELLLKQ